MGQNLQRWLEVILESPDWTNVKIARDLHPHHSNATIQKLKDNNLVVFPRAMASSITCLDVKSYKEKRRVITTNHKSRTRAKLQHRLQ
jgi:hypothetical protein